MDTDRVAAGVRWGVAATLAKTAVTLAGVLTDTTPEPEPMPVAVVERLVGADAPAALVLPLSALAHLAYGATAGAAFAVLQRRPTLTRGVGWGGLLWVVQQAVVLPLVGWGAFGRGVSPKVAVATLVDHLVYGYLLGLGMERRNR